MGLDLAAAAAETQHTCDCPCHGSVLAIRHAAPCCMQCNVCGGRIRMECLKAHAQACRPGVIQQRMTDRLAAIEDTLMEALSFYADPDNWEDTVQADRGERARQALGSLPVEATAG